MDAEGLLNYVRYGVIELNLFVVVQLFRGVVVVSVSCYTAIKVDTSSGNPSGR
ncbi:13556_t:CDS:2 [Rhizophagus irregularis]|nr:13556_t:CDS:2 [Rhizophagus irregularis]